MARTYDNAYFANEQGSAIAGSTVFANRYRELGATNNAAGTFANYLDSSVRKNRQVQSIPSDSAGLPSRYDLFVSTRTLKAIQAARSAKATLPTLNISILFGVGRDLDNLGLRFYFDQADHHVLINVPGAESPRWNFGISGLVDTTRGIVENQVLTLLRKVHIDDVPFAITTLAAYSTGYGSLNQTVNEDLVPLDRLESVVYYDCTYRNDKPAPSPGAPSPTLSAPEKNPGPDEVDKAGHAGSAFNTQRARERIRAATSGKAQFVGYTATSGGSPLYLHANSSPASYTVDFGVKVDLRAPAAGYPVGFADCLYALALTRTLAFAQVDNQVQSGEIPDPFKALAPVLPARGTVASTVATLRAKPGFKPTTTLLDWGRANLAGVQEANKRRHEAIALISNRQLMYVGGQPFRGQSYPDPSNEAGALHASLLPEFAWEYLL